MNIFKITPSGWFFLTFTLSLTLHLLTQDTISLFFSSPVRTFITIGILLIALLINFLTYHAFTRAQTSYEPFTLPRVLITTGIFSLSRNPAYLALGLTKIGLGFVLDSLWIVAGGILLWSILDFFVIRQEEKILLDTFGDSFLVYQRHTRRWI